LLDHFSPSLFFAPDDDHIDAPIADRQLGTAGAGEQER
jgi:hypothetical protein